MNIMQMQKALESVPDNALIQYVKQPGQVPGYLAWSELKRREYIRQQAAARQQAPQQTVADQIAMADQGIASLPVDNVGNPEAYAAGGIVAFNGEEGSSVSLETVNAQRQLEGKRPLTQEEYKLYYGPGTSEDPVTGLRTRHPLTPLTPLTKGAPKPTPNAAPTSRTFETDFSKNQSTINSAFGNAALAGADVLTLPGRAIANAGEDVYNIGAYGINSVLGGEYLPKSNKYSTSMTPFYDMYRTDAPVKTSSADLPGGTNDPVRQRRTAEFLRKQAQEELRKKRGAEPSPAPTGGRRPLFTPGDSAASAAPAQGIETLLKGVKIPFNEADFPISDVTPASAAMAQFQQLIGEDPNRAALNARIAQMDEATAEQVRQAPGRALATMGFTMMAGKSPFALQNVGESGKAGIEDYTASQKDIRAAREKQFALQTELAKAERQEQIAAATYGLNSEQHDKAQAHADKVALATARHQTELKQAEMDAKLEADRLHASQKEREMTETERANKAGEDIKRDANVRYSAGLEKAQIQQQTAILNNLLDESRTRLNNLLTSGATAKEMAAEQARYDRIVSELARVAGFTVPQTSTATGAGTLVKSKNGEFTYQR